MRNRLLSLLACLLLGVTCGLPAAPAQPPAGAKPAGEGDERGAPVLAYGFAILSTVLIMLILLAPSRKRRQQ
jgi:hypothetical protein